ncbi:hypothetical protein E2C01_039056 [Portunus trituberculatus]|uniref:Uncharacterized protein n=1 Tax=Portunus trituberculatus TaxID=210409 RepID=A0A5B7FK49_PORTR|nr:hypothetical protein [Portunus trituberculatus]
MDNWVAGGTAARPGAGEEEAEEEDRVTAWGTRETARGDGNPGPTTLMAAGVLTATGRLGSTVTCSRAATLPGPTAAFWPPGTSLADTHLPRLGRGSGGMADGGRAAGGASSLVVDGDEDEDVDEGVEDEEEDGGVGGDEEEKSRRKVGLSRAGGVPGPSAFRCRLRTTSLSFLLAVPLRGLGLPPPPPPPPCPTPPLAAALPPSLGLAVRSSQVSASSRSGGGATPFLSGDLLPIMRSFSILS